MTRSHLRSTAELDRASNQAIELRHRRTPLGQHALSESPSSCAWRRALTWVRADLGLAVAGARGAAGAAGCGVAVRCPLFFVSRSLRRVPGRLLRNGWRCQQGQTGFLFGRNYTNRSQPPGTRCGRRCACCGMPDTVLFCGWSRWLGTSAGVAEDKLGTLEARRCRPGAGAVARRGRLETLPRQTIRALDCKTRCLGIFRTRSQ